MESGRVRGGNTWWVAVSCDGRARPGPAYADTFGTGRDGVAAGPADADTWVEPGTSTTATAGGGEVGGTAGGGEVGGTGGASDGGGGEGHSGTMGGETEAAWSTRLAKMLCTCGLGQLRLDAPGCRERGCGARARLSECRI
jgi:hypothetical protein